MHSLFNLQIPQTVWSCAQTLKKIVEKCWPPQIGEAQSRFSLNCQKTESQNSVLCAQTLKKLIEKCWHPNPEKRPNFVVIVYELTELLATMPRKGKTGPSGPSAKAIGSTPGGGGDGGSGQAAGGGSGCCSIS